MNGNGEHHRHINRVRVYARFLMARRQGQPVDGAMDGQRHHHGQRDLAEPVSRGLVKMAGRASWANMKDIPGNQREEAVTCRPRQHKLPHAHSPEALRRNGEHRHAQQRSRPYADERAKPFVSPRQQCAGRTASQSDQKRGTGAD